MTKGNKPPKTESRQRRKCATCKGTGQKNGRTCPGCNGSGYVLTGNV